MEREKPGAYFQLCPGEGRSNLCFGVTEAVFKMADAKNDRMIFS